MDNLSDDLLINILSRMSLKEAAKTCVLAHRWEYLWRSVCGTLEFYCENLVTANGEVMKVEKFESLVNTLLEVHQGRYIEGIVISFEGMQEHYEITPSLSHSIDIWMCVALQKEVQRLELRLSPNDGYGFPCLQMLIPHSHPLSFSRLKTLRLVHVEIEDEVVHHLLASAPVLEELCVSFSTVTKNLQVADPPSLRVLEISRCCNIQSVEISAVNLVSLTYGGGKNSLLLKKVPNLCGLTMSDEFAAFYVLEPKQESSYSAQLVELVLYLHSPTSLSYVAVNPPPLPMFISLKRLKVHVFSEPDLSLVFFTSMVKASPQLSEFSIEIRYSATRCPMRHMKIAFPIMCAVEKFDHKSLKVVEIVGFVGSGFEDDFFYSLYINAPLIERVVIDTKSDYYEDSDWDSIDNSGDFWLVCGARTQSISKQIAERLAADYARVQFIIT